MNNLQLIEALIPDMEARVRGLTECFPAGDIVTALHRNESLLAEMKRRTTVGDPNISRRELFEKLIEMENQLMVYKKGLHLAKAFIDCDVGDPDITAEMIEANAEYIKFIKEHNLEGI